MKTVNKLLKPLKTVIFSKNRRIIEKGAQFFLKPAPGYSLSARSKWGVPKTYLPSYDEACRLLGTIDKFEQEYLIDLAVWIP